MPRTLTVLLLGAMVGCNPYGSYQGHLSMALDGTLPPGVGVLAQPDPPSADMSCQARTATPGADGSFTLTDLCPGQGYRLTLTDKTLLIEGDSRVSVEKGAGATEELRVWRAPEGSGLAVLKGDTLEELATYTDVYKVQLQGTGQDILYPRHKLENARVLEDGSWLVIADRVDQMQILPLIEEKATRNFADGYSLEPHYYAGVRFKSDAEIEPVQAPLDPAKHQTIRAGGRTIRYIAADALPAGHYALMEPEDRRMYVVGFGPLPEEATAATATP